LPGTVGANQIEQTRAEDRRSQWAGGATVADDATIGDRIRELRLAVRPRLTQAALAERAGLSVDLIAALEQGKRRGPMLKTAEKIARALGVELAELTLGGSAPTSSPAATSAADGLESPVEIAARAQRMSMSNVDDAVLDLFERVVHDAIGRYETVGPAALAPELIAQRRHVHGLLDAQQRLVQRERLIATAALLSGLLAATALDLGRIATARAYGAEAFHAADMLPPTSDLRAWVRGTQSLIEYYAGDFAGSLALARDGQRLAARSSPQRIRLAVNGEARAAGKLGDHRGVDEAVDRAHALLSEQPPAPAVSASLSLTSYCAARTDGNAATAYLSVGRMDKVEQLAGRAVDMFAALGHTGPLAMTRLDLAVAALRGNHPDPERGAQLVLAALELPGISSFQPVIERAATTLPELRRWPKMAAVSEAIDAVGEVAARVATHV
jgi:transcriptional regulator with XRE-family HTH domain